MSSEQNKNIDILHNDNEYNKQNPVNNQNDIVINQKDEFEFKDELQEEQNMKSTQENLQYQQQNQQDTPDLLTKKKKNFKFNKKKFQETLQIKKEKTRRLIKSRYFEIIVIVFLIVNFVAFLLKSFEYRLQYQYYDENKQFKQNALEIDNNSFSSTRNQISIIIEFICMWFFLIEIIMKMFVKGLKKYFRQGWSYFNIIVWLAGFYYSFITFQIVSNFDALNFLEEQNTFKILATIRMLRPLRIFYSFKILREQVNNIAITIYKSKAILVPILYIVAFYSVVGLYLFKGVFENRCRFDPHPVKVENELIFPHDPSVKNLCGELVCPDDLYCRSPYDYDFDYNKSERDINSLNYGITHFDDILSSIFVVGHFIAITHFFTLNRIFWKSVNSEYTASFFISLCILLSLVTMSIFMSSLFESFKEIREAKQKKKAEKLLLKKQQKKQEIIDTLQRQKLEKQLELENKHDIQGEQERSSLVKENIQKLPTQSQQTNVDSKENNNNNIKQNENQQQNGEKQVFEQLKQDGEEKDKKQESMLRKQSINNLYSSFKSSIQARKPTRQDSVHKQTSIIALTDKKLQTHTVQIVKKNTSKEEHFMEEWRLRIRNLTKRKVYRRLLYFLILLNCLILILDRQGISETELEIYNWMDLILTFLYTINIVLQILGTKKLISWAFKPLNFFDLIITLLNLAEFIYAISTVIDLVNNESITKRAIASLKMYRLFIIIAKIKYFFVMRMIAKSLLKTIASTAYMLVIMFFIYVTTALVALELFAYKVRLTKEDLIPQGGAEQGSPLRLTFDTFYEALVAVFFMYFSEGWPKWMYQYFRFTGYDSIVFFVSAIFIGQVIYLKLYLAFFISEYNKYAERYKIIKVFVEEESDQKDIIRNLKRKIENIYVDERVKHMNEIKDLELKDQKTRKSLRQATNIKLDDNHQIIKVEPVFNNQVKQNKDDNQQQMEQQNQQQQEEEEQQENPVKKRLTRRKTKKNSVISAYILNDKEIYQNQEQQDIEQQQELQEKIVKEEIQEQQINNSQNEEVQNDKLKNEEETKQDTGFKRNSILKLNTGKRATKFKKYSNIKFDIEGNDLEEQDKFKNLNLEGINSLQNLEDNQEEQNDSQSTPQNTSEEDELSSSGDESQSKSELTSGTVSSDMSSDSVGDDHNNQLSIPVMASGGRSFYIFSTNSVIRQKCIQLEDNKYYKIFTLILIVGNNLSLAFESPLESFDSKRNFIMSTIFICTVFLQLQEVIIKSIARGFILNQDSYLRRGYWSKFDFLIMLLGIGSLFYTRRSLRAIFVLRLLNVIPNIQELQMIANAIVSALPIILQAFFFLMVVLTIFSVFLTKEKRGTLYTCTNVIDDILYSQIDTKTDCFDYGGDWVAKDINFDNVIQTVFSLYQIGTGRGITNLVFDTMDAREVDQQPKQNHNQYYTIYFVFFSLIFRLFLMRCFTVLIIQTYVKYRNIIIGFDELDQDQRDWIIIREQILKLIPHVNIIPKDRCRFQLYKFTKTKFYQYFLYTVIIINVLALSLVWHRQDPNLTEILENINLSMIGIIALHIIIQIIINGYHKFKYIKNNWIWVEIFAVISTNAGYYILYENDSWTQNESRLVQATAAIFQMALVYRVLENFTFTRRLFDILSKVLPLMVNFSLMYLLLIIGFGIVGMQLFCYVKPQEFLGNYDDNFVDIWSAMITLFKISTPSDWFRIMNDSSRKQAPNFVCYDIIDFDDYQKYQMNGCGVYTAYPFFILYQTLFSLILFNLFIASIISAYQAVHAASTKAINLYNLDDSIKLWEKYDEKGKGFIQFKDLWIFSVQMAIKMGIEKEELLDYKVRCKILEMLHIPVYVNRKLSIFCFKFHDVMIGIDDTKILKKYVRYLQGQKIIIFIIFSSLHILYRLQIKKSVLEDLLDLNALTKFAIQYKSGKVEIDADEFNTELPRRSLEYFMSEIDLYRQWLAIRIKQKNKKKQKFEKTSYTSESLRILIFLKQNVNRKQRQKLNLTRAATILKQQKTLRQSNSMVSNQKSAADQQLQQKLVQDNQIDQIQNIE